MLYNLWLEGVVPNLTDRRKKKNMNQRNPPLLLHCKPNVSTRRDYTTVTFPSVQTGGAAARSVPKIMSERKGSLTRGKLVEMEVKEKEVQVEEKEMRKRERWRISFIWLGPLGSILGILSDVPAS